MGLGKYRNEPCPCGSGMKFKYCHLKKLDQDKAKAMIERADRERVLTKKLKGEAKRRRGSDETHAG